MLAETLQNNNELLTLQESNITNEKELPNTTLTSTLKNQNQNQNEEIESLDPLPTQPLEKKVSYRYVDSNKPTTTTTIQQQKNQIPLLPTTEYYQTHPVPSKEEILRQFSRLNISGDGKLTFLTLRSALEIIFDSNSSTQQIDDMMIRSWLRENDSGSKGYVDVNDFQRIFRVNNKQTMTQDFPRYRFSDSTNSTASTRRNDFVDADRIAKVKRYNYTSSFSSLIDLFLFLFINFLELFFDMM